MTCSGRDVAVPSFIIGIDDVFEASIASEFVNTRSSSRNRSTFISSSSMIASTTRSRSERSPISVVNDKRSIAESRSSSVILFAVTPRSNDVTRRARPASAASAEASRTSTSSPARAHTSAMPEPINPQPMTPTRSIVFASAILQSCPKMAG